MKLIIIIALYVLSNVNSYPLLKKYGTITMQDQYVLFESKDFNNDEEMHFKLQAGEGSFDYYANSIHNIIYYYSNSAGGGLTSENYAYRKNHKIEDGYLENSYFTIKKKSSEYSSTNGNYMLIYFPNLFVDADDHEAIISNTKEDEGKIETWVIVVIVVVIVAIIVGIIIFCVCRRIRMKKAQQAAMAANAATIAAQNHAAQNAAYEAAAQNAYIAEQNYQAQAYQAQVYQNNNYMTPPGVISNAGYTSNAFM